MRVCTFSWWIRLNDGLTCCPKNCEVSSTQKWTWKTVLVQTQEWWCIIHGYNTKKEGGESGPGTHRKKDTVGVRGDDAGGYRDQEEGRDGVAVGEEEDRWHSPMVQTCSGSVLRTERYIYIFCVLPHLESTPLGRVEHQEAFKEVLAVCGHVERDAVLPSEHTLPQLLQKKKKKGQQTWS